MCVVLGHGGFWTESALCAWRCGGKWRCGRGLEAFGVEFDDVLDLDGERHAFSVGEGHDGGGHLGFIERHPVGADQRGAFDGFQDEGFFGGLFAGANKVALVDGVRGDIHTTSVDGDVPVVDQLACSGDGGGEASAEDDVVKAALKEFEQLDTRVEFAAFGGRHGVAQLAFGKSIVDAEFLLFEQTAAIFGEFTTSDFAVLTGGIRTLVHGFTRKAGQVDAQAAHLFYTGAGITGHEGTSKESFCAMLRKKVKRIVCVCKVKQQGLTDDLAIEVGRFSSRREETCAKHERAL